MEVINICERPEFRANLIRLLADAEEQVQVWTERVEELRQYLGQQATEEAMEI